MKINHEKTQVLRKGGIKNYATTLYTPVPLNWTSTIKVLGVDFTADFSTMGDINYENLLNETKSIGNLWSLRSLTVIGKIQVVNILLISQYVCKLMCLYSPTKAFYEEFEKVIVKFLWGGKALQIAYDKLVQGYDNVTVTGNA